MRGQIWWYSPGIGFRPNMSLGQGETQDKWGLSGRTAGRETSVQGCMRWGTALRFITMPYRLRITLPWLLAVRSRGSSRPITRAAQGSQNPWAFRDQRNQYMGTSHAQHGNQPGQGKADGIRRCGSEIMRRLAEEPEFMENRNHKGEDTY